MPLTLECVCADNDSVASCELVELWWEVSSKYTSRGGIDASNSITLRNGASVVETLTNTGNSEYSVALSTALASNWEDLFVRFAIDSSLSQLASPGAAAIYEVTWRIRAVYECAQPGGEPQRYEVLLYEPAGEDAFCWIVEDVTLRSYIHGGNSGAVGILYSSGPLADCNGVSVDFGAFDLLPATSIDVEASEPGAVCLCPVGGTAPYYFSAIGLPGGLTLNGSTGCIEGTPGDNGGSREVTFTVSDGNRDTATVACMFLSNCGGNGEIPNGFY